MTAAPAVHLAENVEEGPDPNDVRRHAKRMFTEMQYRQKYRRIDFYRPNDKQREFHNSLAKELMLRAGNQQGKTHAAGAQMAMDALALYPEWYEGRRFIKPPPIERPIDFMGWAACTSQVKTRDGAQLKLLGPVGDEDGMGTGLIPLDNITGRPIMARGVSDCVDSISLRRETGGKAMIRFKTYPMGREAFQGEPVDVPWLDEDVSREDASIYGEVLARLTTTRGRIICSMTPLLGLSPLRKRFKQKLGSSMQEVLMTIYDCAVSKGGHIPDEEIEQIIKDTPESERDTRIFGADMAGEGAVFSVPTERIKHSRDVAEIPPYWAWGWGFDFSHGGLSDSAHPFAAVLGAWDRDNDVIYIVDAKRMAKALPINHYEALHKHPYFKAPVLWPHDGGTHTAAGITIAATYKKLGFNMLAKHSTFPDGGYDFYAGIEEMETRFAAGKLLIARHLTEIFDEYAGYHKENGQVHKVDDDLLSAMRQLVMGRRFMKSVTDIQAKFAPRASDRGAVAAGLDFPLF